MLARQARSRARLLRAAREWAKLTGATTTGPHSQTSVVTNRDGTPVRVTVTVQLRPAGDR